MLRISPAVRTYTESFIAWTDHWMIQTSMLHWELRLYSPSSNTLRKPGQVPVHLSVGKDIWQRLWSCSFRAVEKFWKILLLPASLYASKKPRNSSLMASIRAGVRQQVMSSQHWALCPCHVWARAAHPEMWPHRGTRELLEWREHAATPALMPLRTNSSQSHPGPDQVPYQEYCMNTLVYLKSS